MRELEERLEGNWGATCFPIPVPSPDSGRDILKAMIDKTVIVNSSEAKLKRIRRLYEMFDSQSEFTKCLCQFWRSRGGVEVRVDFDSGGIDRMQSKFVDHDGVVRNGNFYFSFADFTNGVLYVAGGYPVDVTLGLLASGLAQMCFYVAFGNGGRPYERGDHVAERALEAAIEEAEGKRRCHVHLHWCIRNALETMKTYAAIEIYITSAVPRIISLHGPTEGTSLLRKQVPSLLDFYECRVLPALLEKAILH
jgi:hypothetical protein